MFSPNAIKEFQALYKTLFGVDLSAEEAADIAGRLINLYKTIHKEN